MNHPYLSALVLAPLLAALAAIFVILLNTIFGRHEYGILIALIIAAYALIWFFIRVVSVVKNKFRKLGYIFTLSPQSIFLACLIWIASKSIFFTIVAVLVFIIVDFFNTYSRVQKFGALSEPKT